MNVVIIGAGGMAKAVTSILMGDRNFNISGFIDVNKESQGKTIFDIPIVTDHTGLKGIYNSGVTCAFVAVGDNDIRERHFYELTQIGFQIINIIHPTAIIAKNVELETGIFVSKGAIIEPFVKVFNNTFIGVGAIIGLESALSENVYVGAGAIIGNSVNIQRNVRVNAGALVKPFTTIEKRTVIDYGEQYPN